MKDSAQVFADLRRIMLPYARKLECKADTDAELNVETNHILKNGKPLWFGAVRVSKNYVGYHLMPVYVSPELLADMSPALKKHMQGKSCFNFKTSDAELFSELAALTDAAYRFYERQGYV